MTAADIAARIQRTERTDPNVRKAYALCDRMRVPRETVAALLKGAWKTAFLRGSV